MSPASGLARTEPVLCGDGGGVGESERAVIISASILAESGDNLPRPSAGSSSTRVDEVADEADTELSLLRVAEELARDLETELTLLAVVDIGVSACRYRPFTFPWPRGWHGGRDGSVVIKRVRRHR